MITKKEAARFPKLPEMPVWYCCKATYYNDGRVEAEIVKDEKSNIAIAIQDEKKPLDGAFETANATIYYIYGKYEEVAKHVAMAAGF